MEDPECTCSSLGKCLKVQRSAKKPESRRPRSPPSKFESKQHKCWKCQWSKLENKTDEPKETEVCANIQDSYVAKKREQSQLQPKENHKGLDNERNSEEYEQNRSCSSGWKRSRSQSYGEESKGRLSRSPPSTSKRQHKESDLWWQRQDLKSKDKTDPPVQLEEPDVVVCSKPKDGHGFNTKLEKRKRKRSRSQQEDDCKELDYKRKYERKRSCSPGCKRLRPEPGAEKSKGNHSPTPSSKASGSSLKVVQSENFNRSPNGSVKNNKNNSSLCWNRQYSKFNDDIVEPVAYNGQNVDVEPYTDIVKSSSCCQYERSKGGKNDENEYNYKRKSTRRKVAKHKKASPRRFCAPSDLESILGDESAISESEQSSKQTRKCKKSQSSPSVRINEKDIARKKSSSRSPVNRSKAQPQKAYLTVGHCYNQDARIKSTQEREIRVPILRNKRSKAGSKTDCDDCDCENGNCNCSTDTESREPEPTPKKPNQKVTYQEFCNCAEDEGVDKDKSPTRDIWIKPNIAEIQQPQAGASKNTYRWNAEEQSCECECNGEIYPVKVPPDDQRVYNTDPVAPPETLAYVSQTNLREAQEEMAEQSKPKRSFFGRSKSRPQECHCDSDDSIEEEPFDGRVPPVPMVHGTLYSDVENGELITDSERWKSRNNYDDDRIPDRNAQHEREITHQYETERYPREVTESPYNGRQYETERYPREVTESPYNGRQYETERYPREVTEPQYNGRQYETERYPRKVTESPYNGRPYTAAQYPPSYVGNDPRQYINGQYRGGPGTTDNTYQYRICQPPGMTATTDRPTAYQYCQCYPRGVTDNLPQYRSYQPPPQVIDATAYTQQYRSDQPPQRVIDATDNIQKYRSDQQLQGVIPTTDNSQQYQTEQRPQGVTAPTDENNQQPQGVTATTDTTNQQPQGVTVTTDKTDQQPQGVTITTDNTQQPKTNQQPQGVTDRSDQTNQQPQVVTVITDNPQQPKTNQQPQGVTDSTANIQQYRINQLPQGVNDSTANIQQYKTVQQPQGVTDSTANIQQYKTVQQPQGVTDSTANIQQYRTNQLPQGVTDSTVNIQQYQTYQQPQRVFATTDNIQPYKNYQYPQEVTDTTGKIPQYSNGQLPWEISNRTDNIYQYQTAPLPQRPINTADRDRPYLMVECPWINQPNGARPYEPPQSLRPPNQMDHDVAQQSWGRPDQIDDSRSPPKVDTYKFDYVPTQSRAEPKAKTNRNTVNEKRRPKKGLKSMCCCGTSNDDDSKSDLYRRPANSVRKSKRKGERPERVSKPPKQPMVAREDVCYKADCPYLNEREPVSKPTAAAYQQPMVAREPVRYRDDWPYPNEREQVRHREDSYDTQYDSNSPADQDLQEVYATIDLTDGPCAVICRNCCMEAARVTAPKECRPDDDFMRQHKAKNEQLLRQRMKRLKAKEAEQERAKLAAFCEKRDRKRPQGSDSDEEHHARRRKRRNFEYSEIRTTPLYAPKRDFAKEYEDNLPRKRRHKCRSAPRYGSRKTNCREAPAPYTQLEQRSYQADSEPETSCESDSEQLRCTCHTCNNEMAERHDAGKENYAPPHKRAHAKRNAYDYSASEYAECDSIPDYVLGREKRRANKR